MIHLAKTWNDKVKPYNPAAKILNNQQAASETVYRITKESKTIYCTQYNPKP